jgi:hypothetical protein
MAAEIRREILIAKLEWGDDDLEIRMIESSWGVTLDDRETLGMIRSVNHTALSASVCHSAHVTDRTRCV